MIDSSAGANDFRYADLFSAGRELALRFGDNCTDHDLVLAIANGGVPAGFELAKHIRVPLDLIFVRRLLAPSGPSAPVCAVSIGGVVVVDADELVQPHSPATGFAHYVADVLAELTSRAVLCRADRKAVTLAGRKVVLVDNGIHTGSTMLIALRALKTLKPARITVCVPVAAAESKLRVAAENDRLFCPAWVKGFGNVALWYSNFNRPSGEEVRQLMKTYYESFAG